MNELTILYEKEYIYFGYNVVLPTIFFNGPIYEVEEITLFLTSTFLERGSRSNKI